MKKKRKIECVKIAYSRENAVKQARFWNTRPYRCPNCHRWHLTKADRENMRA